GMTSPNPVVGAVIVNKGRVVGKGYHKGPGQLHAEAVAIRESGSEASGATLYVNLEPCCHTDKRTPPCTKDIIRSGIRRVVTGMTDPNPAVNGLGVAELIDAGLTVEKDVLNNDSCRINEIYAKFITSNIPFVILKSAASLDGKIALASGESRWITGEAARRYSHKLRSMVDAIMVGIGTVLADDPVLSVRHIKNKERQPLRIIVDSKLRIPFKSKVLDVSTGQKTMVVTTRQAPSDKLKELEGLGIGIVKIPLNPPFPKGEMSKREMSEEGETSPPLEKGGQGGFETRLSGEDGKPSLRLLMNHLGKTGITSILIEGGAEINASALRDEIVDKVVLFYSARIIGGRDSIGMVGGHSPKSLDESIFLKDVKIKRLAEDIMLEGYVR
ncbi:MAG TPA: bifunctional diaminohydroxyphosphoribosylaminopyrimidine deaminase/5-amino-6-(5-phosphoribosylamino)uracil reductase RibD, partial [Nitrospirota bacterium]|nr:bifunctional diaminohydroxyphosphoribosylaminopyrimidine deaminase/5-amino-6-(5-phosphoribosylamino)uracil reductase RibD [Nitrospirota bacterium]